MNEQSEEHVASAAEGLKDLAEEFAGQLGRKPTSDELLTIITLALKSGSGNVLSDVNPSNIRALRPEFKKAGAEAKSRKSVAAPSTVKELNDAVFVIAGDLIAQLTSATPDAVAPPLTLNRFCKLLLEALHRCADDLLSDVAPKHIIAIKADTNKKRKVSVEPGDIVAIPARNGEYFIAVAITKNRYGVAYGLFQGTSEIKPVSMNAHPPVIPHPVYSSDEFIMNARWKVIGHDETLLSLFPRDPEIYFPKQVIRGAEDYMNRIAQYGSGKTAAGNLRDLSREEAEELGLLNGEYRQSYLPEILERRLNQKLG